MRDVRKCPRECQFCLCLLCPSRLKWTSLASTYAHCSRQLRYRSSESAAFFYCYLLIGGTGESFYSEDGDDVLYLPPAR